MCILGTMKNVCFTIALNMEYLANQTMKIFFIFREIKTKPNDLLTHLNISRLSNQLATCKLLKISTPAM